MPAFKMDRNFERNVKRDLQKAMQTVADQVFRQHSGQPLAVTKPAVKRAFESAGMKITDPELTQYAQQITDGGKINFKVK